MEVHLLLCNGRPVGVYTSRDWADKASAMHNETAAQPAACAYQIVAIGLNTDPRDVITPADYVVARSKFELVFAAAVHLSASEHYADDASMGDALQDALKLFELAEKAIAKR